ncbi:Ku70/Ku80 beta-barrel domain protein [Oesophagostomum dentatum]|uniref:Ku70/Ku80 beta-barrel domain protein n=1 Tax=Oesophagostomum dentatum TaxID=61180 RepID=A0A0B1SUS9_OESDE|nr:Ku70/Ku80 beta-barrel domain protein [Oesophagostomum dentatum]
MLIYTVQTNKSQSGTRSQSNEPQEKVKEEMETDVLEDTKWLGTSSCSCSVINIQIICFTEHEVESRTRAKFELKKAIKIGGECIVSEQSEIEELGRFDAKGIVLLGFRPISEVNFTNHIQPSRFIYPDESNVLGSACLYRALLERCWERKMAMICRFCSRANQKVRLVALVPHMREKNESRTEAIRDYDFDGFHVVFLPFAEDVRDVSEKMKCPQGDWPKPSKSDVSVASAFVKKLTGSYTPSQYENPTSKSDVSVASAFVKKLTGSYAPSQYENPRLQSFYAMIIENVVGEQIVKPTDTLLPYHARPEWAARVDKEAKNLIKHFNLEELEKMASPARKRADDSEHEGSRSKKKKTDLSEMDIREIAEKGLLDSLTVAQLRAAIGEHLACTVKQGTKKAEMVKMLEKYFKV